MKKFNRALHKIKCKEKYALTKPRSKKWGIRRFKKTMKRNNNAKS